MIFQSNAEFSRNHDHRLVGEAHASFERGAVAANEIRRLVNFKPDAVTRAMRQTWEIVVRSKSFFAQGRARGGIHPFARNANFCSIESSGLRALFGVPDLPDFLVGSPNT
jgi:hypothetical protein